MRVYVLCALIFLPSFACAQELPTEHDLMSAPFQHESERVVPPKPFVMNHVGIQPLFSTQTWTDLDTLRAHNEYALGVQVLAPVNNTARTQYGLKLLVPIMKVPGEVPPTLFATRPNTNPYAHELRKSKVVAQFTIVRYVNWFSK